MPAIEIITKISTADGVETFLPTDDKGRKFDSVNDWIFEKNHAGIRVIDVTSQVNLKNVPNWKAYEERCGKETIITFFEIT